MKWTSPLFTLLYEVCVNSNNNNTSINNDIFLWCIYTYLYVIIRVIVSSLNKHKQIIIN